MPFFVRIIRHSRWYIQEEKWLQKGEIPADTLIDLRTEKNKLSVWVVEDNKSNLDRVLTAFAANRNDIDNLDYALFKQSIISKCNIQTEKSDAETPDREANISWHYNFIQLSAQKLVNLATMIIEENAELERIPKQRITQMIKEAVESGYIDSGKLKSGILKEINKIS